MYKEMVLHSCSRVKFWGLRSSDSPERLSRVCALAKISISAKKSATKVCRLPLSSSLLHHQSGNHTLHRGSATAAC